MDDNKAHESTSSGSLTPDVSEVKGTPPQPQPASQPMPVVPLSATLGTNQSQSPMDPTTMSSEPVQTRNVFKSKKKLTQLSILVVVLIILGAIMYRYRGLFVAATVNGTPIGRLDVVREAEAQAGKKALDFMIVTTLIEQEAKKKNISISNEDIAAQVKKIQDSVAAQGGTFDDFLKQQGITEDQLKKDIILQLRLEKLVNNQPDVTDAEVDAYIKNNGVTIDSKQDQTSLRNQIKDQIKQNKFNDAARTYVSTLRSQAKINYFVNY